MSGPLIDVGTLAQRIEDDPDLVVLEVNERPQIYRAGHITGAHNIDWHTDLHQPRTRDVPAEHDLQALWERVGITQDSTVVLYGDQHNWYAAYAYWLLQMHGIQRLAILDGGRQAWIASGLPLVRDVPGPASGPAPTPRHRTGTRAMAEDTVALLRVGGTVIDVRTHAEYRGDLYTEAGYDDEGAQRAGHIPGATHFSWDEAIGDDGRFLSPDALTETLAGHDISAGPVITYCRIGERSAHTWFVLHELLGWRDVRNYDGSWTEWGNMIGLPIATGDAPGSLPDHAVARLEAA